MAERKAAIHPLMGMIKGKNMKDSYKAGIIEKHIEATKNDEYYNAQVTGSAGKNINLDEGALNLLKKYYEGKLQDSADRLVVTTVHSFSSDTPTVLFGENEYKKASAYLEWLWKSYYEEEKAQNSALDHDKCRCDEEYAVVTWEDGNKTEFILTSTSSPVDGFKYED